MNAQRTAVAQAMSFWRAGKSLPAHLTALLEARGMNVAALEEKHLNN